MNKKLYLSLTAALVAVFLFSSFIIARQVIDSKKSANNFEQLEQVIVDELPVIDIEETEEVPELTAYEKYKELYALNNDFIGWITIDDTAVNYPVMQSVDRPNYYLKKNFDKKYSDYGVPYVDEKCGIDLSNNTILYGHNMKNGTMFSDLLKYTKQSFYDDHKVIQFNTLSGMGEYEIVSVFKIDVDSDPFFYTNYTDMNEVKFKDFILNVKAKSFYETGITAEYGDTLLTLSTCESTLPNGRLVVVAKKTA